MNGLCRILVASGRNLTISRKLTPCVPLPAWDMDGSLILLKDYASKLANATVQLNFALRGWDFARDRKKTFSLLVHEIVVIARFNATTSPLKRRTTEDTGSPSKENRLGA
jgi:hypothetical protein